MGQLHLEDYITKKHIEYMNIVILITGGMGAWDSGFRIQDSVSSFEDFTYLSPGAATGPFWWWALIPFFLVVCNFDIY